MTHEPIEVKAKSGEEVDRTAVVELARTDPRVHEGELEIDDNAVVSFAGENGAYVQAWLWVDFTGTPLGEAAEDDSAETSGR